MFDEFELDYFDLGTPLYLRLSRRPRRRVPLAVSQPTRPRPPHSHTTESVNDVSCVLPLFSITDQPVGHGNVLLSLTPPSYEPTWTPPPSGRVPVGQ